MSNGGQRKRYTVFIEVATVTDPPWVTYRFVRARSRDQAVKVAIDQYLEDNEATEDLRQFLSGWRVFSGFIQEVEQ